MPDPETATQETEQPEEVIEEVSPLDLIEMVSDDLAIALAALKRIVRIKPHLLPGGPNNKNFGKRFQQAFEKAQKEALDAVLKIKEQQ